MKRTLLLLAGCVACLNLLAQEAKPRVLIVGGGSSHDFSRWFDAADRATLAPVAAKVDYTDKPEQIPGLLSALDVLFLSNNQPLAGEPLRKALFGFAEAGKGLLLVHPAVWNNWPDWPEYNRQLVGGGASSHEAYGEFEVTVNEPAHPIMKGVAASFRVKDELYRFQKDPEGPAIEILATGKSLATGKTFPVVWITRHSKARIVCISLGHDGAAHDLAEYQAILRNSCGWVFSR